ncbi:phosphotransferase enzyme family protein [Deinococcus sedimenti]|uniref:Aminoglycoside phosphotransferase domain-containing protein n=1 Tax=Deinococcus sedimenti TaxID=1867090 RepID=A0ABQ2S5F9_9DEIO|nr:phosphotransferase [Deinococcus sedimenti]GGR99057.1 hypothetical protein GCM10008960_27120 [Deinococcus sedimenti]
MTPPPDLLLEWDLRDPQLLGGRLNRHWQVRAGSEVAALRRWHDPDAAPYELDLLTRLTGCGLDLSWRLRGPSEMDGAVWTLHAWVPGQPAPREDARTRGRWLADLHGRWAAVPLPENRPGFPDELAVLHDPSSDALLDAHEAAQPGWVGLLRAHLHAARAATAHVHTRPRRLIHGDFTPWNLRVQDGQWTGLLDLEFTRPADPLADFALAWRGAHDDVIHGYAEVSPLSDEDRALIPALWWAHLLTGALHDLRAGTRDDGWTARMLARRSPLMGALGAALPGVRYSGAL